MPTYFKKIFGVCAIVVLCVIGVQKCGNREALPNSGKPGGLSVGAPKDITSGATSTNFDPDKAVAEERIKKLVSNASSFFGQVVDQTNHPIEGASVEIRANDNPLGKGSVYSKTTDANGRFSIANVRGVGIFVQVAKPGYYYVVPRKKGEPASIGSFAFSAHMGLSVYVPDEEKPAIFILYKPAVQEPLLKLKSTRYGIPRDGSPRVIKVAVENGVEYSIRVSCLTQNQGAKMGDHYDWHFQIDVPDGLLMEYENPFDFKAPQAGYQHSDALEMKKNAPPNEWKESVERRYFLKYKNGAFARIHIEMNTYGQHFLVLQSWLNPNVGSRNLESDPEKD